MNGTKARAAPAIERVVGWLRSRLFPSWPNTAVTLAILYLAWKLLPWFFEWAFLAAVWSPDNPELCRQAVGHGACWAFVADKYRFILFGTFPAAEHWRPAWVLAILLMLYAASAARVLTPKHLAFLWTIGLAGIATLMWGGIFSLTYVENERWGGLTLTLLLATFGIAGAFPIAILLALGRRSELPLVRWLCVIYIELIRGVPLISLLFMASVMLPLFLPAGVSIDKLLRAQLAMIGFAAAYLAEVVRGGLQAIPRQQEEAAQALGLSYWQRIRHVILPQALRLSIPPLVNTFIGFFKDTSLVVIIGLYDFLATIKVSLAEPAWTGFGIEAYLFAAVGYFIFCYPISRYSQEMEKNSAFSSKVPVILRQS
jgi:general L-amino acid transport system permease protein